MLQNLAGKNYSHEKYVPIMVGKSKLFFVKIDGLGSTRMVSVSDTDRFDGLKRLDQIEMLPSLGSRLSPSLCNL